MRITPLLLAATLLLSAAPDLRAQRRSGGAARTATLAIIVTDPAGTPIDQVKVALQGPATRSAVTEKGRIVFEGLPPGTYLLRFDREEFVARERELTARAGAPTNVKVTLTPLPPPPPKPAEPVAPPPAANAQPMMIDLIAFIEKNLGGKAPSKTSPLACSGGGGAELIQVREPLSHPPHPEADEFLYVVAGSGGASIAGRQDLVKPGGFLLVPRGASHAFSARGKTPLILLSIRAGEKCSPPETGRGLPGAK
jgi:mannose-6-phosphate isomerase-like protein (cupin superfamily)